uniref:Uncharacterized protein n=1 Tax=Branchiostoma floridae TaxID=7739 RepID=C3YCN0_BRAFL|eukprot:XP_002605821.1 hypothetical protein BRAFLDRAFT_84306 [Branchiostoma floridae]
MKPPLTRRSFQSHARVRKESSSGGTASFMYRHPLLCLCLVLFIEDVLWLSWLYTSNSDCDCPGMAGFEQERQLQRSLHMKERDDTRKEIWEKTRVQDYLYASKKSMPLGSVIPFFEGRNKSTYYMVPDVYNYLPEEVHWPKSMYENCSVIGNGGILLNSSCGPEIDSTQYVFSMYDFKKERIITDFVEYLSQYEDKGAKVWSHMFHYDSKAKLVLRAIVIIRAMGAKTEMVSSHPVFLQAVNDFWKMNGLTSTRISSGLVFTTIALAMCKETHLYGYWPFPVDYEGQEVPYHYYLYDYQHTQNNTFHKLPEEFKMLQTLHKKGVIKLHIGKCKQ